MIIIILIAIRRKVISIASIYHTRWERRASVCIQYGGYRTSSPEGRPGLSDVYLLSGISGLSFESAFLSPLLIFFSFFLFLFLSSLLVLYVCHFSANGLVFCFVWSFFFSRKLKYFSLRVRLFCMALVEQLGDESW